MESNVKLGPNVHGPGEWEEILLVEKIALEDANVKAEIAKLGLPEGTAIVSDPWIYGRSGRDFLPSKADIWKDPMGSMMTAACINAISTCEIRMT